MAAFSNGLGGAPNWTWQPNVPESWCPELGSTLEACGQELWWGEQYILWNATHANCPQPFRYCGWVKYAWSPLLPVVHGQPWIPHQGEAHTVVG